MLASSSSSSNTVRIMIYAEYVVQIAYNTVVVEDHKQ